MCRAIRPTAPTREYGWVERAPLWVQPRPKADPARSSAVAGPGIHPDNNRHAGAKAVAETVRVVDDNLHGDTLPHLGEISGGVVGRQERELRAGARSKREHVAAQTVARERIHGDLGRLAYIHVRQLGLLVIR